MDWLLQFPIAHRGLHNKYKNIPENSLSAFSKSIEAGFPIELDVHKLIDGNIVVFHDDNLKRMTKFDGLIEQKTKEDIIKLRLLGTEQNIPLLEEVLDLVNGKVPLLIELKNGGKIGELESRLLNQLRLYKGDCAIQSFNPYSLQWFKKNAPQIVRGQVSGDFSDKDFAFYKKFFLRNLLLNKFSEPHFISYDIKCLPFWRVSKLRNNGIPIIGWVIRSKADEDKAKKYCDNIIFEGPLRIKRIMKVI